jgi:phage-related minor tail protein
VVLGQVSTKHADLELIESLKTRVTQAAEVLAKAHSVSPQQTLDCLALSPQCGFSSSSLAGGKDMTMNRKEIDGQKNDSNHVVATWSLTLIELSFLSILVLVLNIG